MKSFWSEEDDQMLWDKINECDGDWNKIAKFFPDRTLGAIKIRWKRIDPSFASGKWESEEDSKLIEWIMNLAIASVDSFHIDSRPRRKNDVMKRIEYWKQILESQLWNQLKTKGRSRPFKQRKRELKYERKVTMKNDLMDSKTSIEKTKSEPLNSSLNQISSRVKKENNEDSKQDYSNKPNLNDYSSTSEFLGKFEYFKKYNLTTSLTTLWTQNEEQQLLELVKVLGIDWSSISKFVTNKPTDEIRAHCYSLLKWTGYWINEDIERDNQSFKKVLNHENIKYTKLEDPHMADDKELLELVEAALYLVDEGYKKFFDSPEKNIAEQVKNEDTLQINRFNFDLFANGINKDELSEESSDDSQR